MKTHTDGTSRWRSRGAASHWAMALAFVLLLAAVAQAPVLESVRLVSALTIRGSVGTTNWIWCADVQEMNKWRVLTNIVVADSPYVFMDWEASPHRRFYQAALGPVAPMDPNRWAWIVPGTFTMGSPASEQDRGGGESPQTQVTLTRGFWMGRYEVTQGEYQAVMGSNPSRVKGDTNRPVENVTWFDATNYCGKLTVAERQAGRLPAGWVYRLPTEAEWEYACRAGTTTRFSWGDDPDYIQLGRQAWFGLNSGFTTYPVGTKLANRWGLYDMHGNVSEWCSDWFEVYPGGSVTDPARPGSGSYPYRVVRGGSYIHAGRFCRSAYRGTDNPDNWTAILGFRVVLGLALAEAPVLESVRLVSALTIRGSVGTTNWMLCADALDTNKWGVLTNFVVTSSPYVFMDWEALPHRRFYRAASGPEGPVIPVNTNRWAWIPPGTFTMGSPASEQDRYDNEGPQTEVTLTRGFWMGRYEVTQVEYIAVTGSNPSGFRGDPNRPVEYVRWFEATNYCGMLTVAERQAGRLPPGYVYRLPTEAEWEYACRAGTTTRFSYGDDPGYSQLGQYAWHSANSDGTTHVVGTKLPNPWGLYDMHGNVWEWCSDWWGAYPGGRVTDPAGPGSGSFRLLRGGGWEYGGRHCRSAVRSAYNPADRVNSLGFRVVLAPGQW